VIWNKSARPLAPVHIAFLVPDWEMSMSLLADPHKQYPARRSNPRLQVRDNSGDRVGYSIARDNYVFPSYPPIRHERQAVLNPRIARSFLLYPGEYVEGWLLAVGERSIPADYPDRLRIKIRLTLFDHRGRSQRAFFHPMVQRSRQEQRCSVEIASGDETWSREHRPRAAARLGQDLKPHVEREEKTIQVPCS
jgi:hypothetical protein